jgi:hypothetical protein
MPPGDGPAPGLLNGVPMTGLTRDFFRPPSQDAPFDAWFTPGRFACILGLVFLASFPEVLLGVHTFVIRDFGYFGYPLAYHHREAIWRGEIPLWDPLSRFGIPFLAQWNTLVLYPLSLFYLVFPLSWSLGVFCIGHLYLGGLGMYFLAHRWTGSRFAACVAGLAFAYSGLSLNCLMWPNNSAALGLLPWVLLTAEAAWTRGGRALLLAALCGAAQMLSGAPEFILMTWLLAAGLWLLAWARRDRPGRELFRRAVAQVALVAAIAAVQLLPFLQLVSVSQRDRGFADAAWSMPGLGWLNFLVPVFGSFPSTRPMYRGVFFQPDQFWTSSYYAGIGVFLFALLAPWRSHDRRARLLAIAAGVALLLALGDGGHLYTWLRKLVPLVGYFRFPIKLVLISSFALPLLAAYTLAGYAAAPGRVAGRCWRAEGLAAAGFLLVIAAIVWISQVDSPLGGVPGKTLENAVTRALFLAAALACVLMISRAREARGQWAAGILLLAVTWFDVHTHVPQQNPTAPRRVFEPNLARQKLALQPQPDTGRSRALPRTIDFAEILLPEGAAPVEDYLVNRLGLPENSHLLDDVPSVRGVYSLHVREADDIIGMIDGRKDGDLSGLLDFIGVSQVLPPGARLRWEARPSALPLVTAGQKPYFLDRKETLYWLGTARFQPRSMVFLPRAETPRVAAAAAADATVRVLAWSAQRVEAEVASTAPSLVVVSQTWHPAWKAYVDGRPAALLRANHAFQAVQAPAGRHAVTLVYEDRAFQLGALISCAALLGSAVAWRRLA